MPREIRPIKIYTDGSCSEGRGGWAAIVIWPDGTIKRYAGYVENTKSECMEILAAINGLLQTRTNSHIILYTDYRPIVKVMNSPRTNKKSNNDLWEQLYSSARFRNIAWEWVKSHNGTYHNEEADKLSRAASQNKHEQIIQANREMLRGTYNAPAYTGSAEMWDYIALKYT